MSIKFSVYVGPYLKCVAKKENLEYFWDIMDDDLYCRTEEELPDGKTAFYVVANTKIKGISRKMSFHEYDDEMQVVCFDEEDEPFSAEKEVDYFINQFRGKIKELSKECESCEVEFGVIPDFS